jgi:NAD(P)-dependent dehydrogenase (short-subunit alcohol dehydrogenase family)
MDGKVALISGGARGQGASHAEVFAREGAKVLIGDLRAELGAAVANRLSDEGLAVRYTDLNVTRPEDWERAVGLAEQEFGRLNVLVNNAGVLGSMKNLTDETLEDWHSALAVNQTGVFLGMKYAIPAMRRAGGGPMAEEEGEESNEAVRLATPMGRGCTADEISWGVLYLASEESRYVTGTDLVIDGGYCAQ